MANEDWTPVIGLRRTAVALIWRSAIAAMVWGAMLWGFHSALNGIGIKMVPMLIAVGFAAAAGSIAGVIISRGMEETAGFVSPLITLMAMVFTAAAIIGTEAIFERLYPSSTDHFRYIIVGATLIFAGACVVKYTLFAD